MSAGQKVNLPVPNRLLTDKLALSFFSFVLKILALHGGAVTSPSRKKNTRFWSKLSTAQLNIGIQSTVNGGPHSKAAHPTTDHSSFFRSRIKVIKERVPRG